MTTAVAAAAVAALTLAALPAIGQPLEGGIYAGCICSPTGQLSAVVLLPDAPPAKRMTWQAATEWAQGLGAELPNRQAALLMYGTVKAQFEEAWYWTSDTPDWDDEGAYAWFQYFVYGSQYDLHKSYEGRCRAVRLIHLVP